MYRHALFDAHYLDSEDFFGGMKECKLNIPIASEIVADEKSKEVAPNSNSDESDKLDASLYALSLPGKGGGVNEGLITSTDLESRYVHGIAFRELVLGFILIFALFILFRSEANLSDNRDFVAFKNNFSLPLSTGEKEISDKQGVEISKYQKEFAADRKTQLNKRKIESDYFGDFSDISIKSNKKSVRKPQKQKESLLKYL